MQFTDVYDSYKHDIKVSALSQRVPGLDYDDVVSEMTICLWKAAESYKPGKTSFGAYWWSLWLNRKATIARDYHAKKRITYPVLTDEPLVEDTYTMERVPEPPKDSNAQDRLVWDLLASGENARDTMDLAQVSRRGYYDTLGRWRTDKVRESLRDA